jgi:hypothetical protein
MVFRRIRSCKRSPLGRARRVPRMSCKLSRIRTPGKGIYTACKSLRVFQGRTLRSIGCRSRISCDRICSSGHTRRTSNPETPTCGDRDSSCTGRSQESSPCTAARIFSCRFFPSVSARRSSYTAYNCFESPGTPDRASNRDGMPRRLGRTLGGRSNICS